MTQALYRLRRADQSLVFAACAPRWRPAVELALALALLPTRSLDVIDPSATRWNDFLVGALNEAPGRERVWLIRGVEGDAFDPAVASLNFHRDDIACPGMRIWIWIRPNDLEKLAHAAPDLWRYRSAVLDLQARILEEIALPTPMPPIPWPWSWRSRPEEPSGEDEDPGPR